MKEENYLKVFTMARKRFSDLDKVLDGLRLGKVDVNTLPPNLDFVQYAKWKQGDVTRVLAARPDLQGEVPVGVVAFGLNDTDDAAKILVSMTGRSQTAIAGISGVKAALAYTTTITDYNPNAGFVPAKARISVKKTGTAEKSEITGRKYKDTTGDAYTGVMGQGATVKFFAEAINAILALTPFAGANATHRISFSSEQWRRD